MTDIPDWRDKDIVPGDVTAETDALQKEMMTKITREGLAMLGKAVDRMSPATWEKIRRYGGPLE